MKKTVAFIILFCAIVIAFFVFLNKKPWHISVEEAMYQTYSSDKIDANLKELFGQSYKELGIDYIHLLKTEVHGSYSDDQYEYKLGLKGREFSFVETGSLMGPVSIASFDYKNGSFKYKGWTWIEHNDSIEEYEFHEISSSVIAETAFERIRDINDKLRKAERLGVEFEINEYD